MAADAKKVCRTPTKGRDGVTRIPLWKYDAVHAAIVAAVAEAGEAGLPFKDLASAVAQRLVVDDLDNLGSIGWHTTTVKLEMEVAGELQRIAGKGPQRLCLMQAASRDEG